MSKTLVRLGTEYLGKNIALDQIEFCAKTKRVIVGIEVVSITDDDVQTSVNKTVWFKSQRGVYKAAKLFVMRQMVGKWNWAEIKY